MLFSFEACRPCQVYAYVYDSAADDMKENKNVRLAGVSENIAAVKFASCCCYSLLYAQYIFGLCQYIHMDGRMDGWMDRRTDVGQTDG